MLTLCSGSSEFGYLTKASAAYRREKINASEALKPSGLGSGTHTFKVAGINSSAPIRIHFRIPSFSFSTLEAAVCTKKSWSAW